MKFLPLIFLSVCCMSRCADLKVLDSTSQQWTGGIRSAGTGVDYRLTIITNKSSADLHIDRIWVGDKSFDVKVSRKFPATEKDGFDRGDTIYVTAGFVIKPPPAPGDYKTTTNDTSQINNPHPPYSYEGDALIRYKTNNKIKYVTVEKIVKKKPLIYP